MQRPVEEPSTATAPWGNDLYSLLRPGIQPTALGSPLETPELHHLPGRPNLFIIPGSVNLVRFENNLAMVSSVGDAVSTLGTFRRQILSVAVRHSVDIVLVDFGPSNGVINKVFVMSCDYIIPPAFPDRLSYDSVTGLIDTVLVGWFEWYNKAISVQEEILLRASPEDRDYYQPFCLPIDPPKLLPLVVSCYKSESVLSTTDPGYATTPYSTWFLLLCKAMSAIADPVRFVPWPHDSNRVLAFLPYITGPISKSHLHRVALVECDEQKESQNKEAANGDEWLVRIAKTRFKSLAQTLWKLHYEPTLESFNAKRVAITRSAYCGARRRVRPVEYDDEDIPSPKKKCVRTTNKTNRS